MSFDPREQVKDILQTVTATTDSGGVAQIIVLYSGGWENLKHLFFVNDYDALIMIDPPTKRRSAPQKSRQDVPTRYDSDVPVHVLAVNKSDVTAAILLEKIRVDIMNTVEGSAQQALYSVYLGGVTPANSPRGGYDPLWQDNYVIEIRPFTEG